jgi:hypothetical protein
LNPKNDEGEYDLDPYNELAEEYPKDQVFYALDELKDFISNSVTKYYNIESNTE